MRRLGRLAIRKGFLAGNPLWSLIGVLLFAPRVWRMLFGRREESVRVGPLVAGEQISLRAVARSGRRR